MMTTSANLIPAHIRAEIDKWLLRYPSDQKRSGVFEALRLVQEANGGWLTTELMDEVAALLQIPNIAVYEVATFYSLYFLTPVGKHMIDVCTNISCMMNGSKEIMDHLQNKLEVSIGGTSKDGQFTLRSVECLGACVGAPACQIGKKYHEHLTPQKMDEILAELKR
jgi:NADH-quinone oxidoreductase subunit E